jgi:hypothetical protein
MIIDRTTLGRSAAPLLRWWWVIVVATLCGAVAGHVVAPRLQTYRATTTILVGAPTAAPMPHVADIDSSEKLTRVLVDVIPQEQVLGPVTDRLGLPVTWRQLQHRIHVAVVGSAERLIQITATARSAAEAEAIVGAIPDQVASVAFGSNDASGPVADWAGVQEVQRRIAASPFDDTRPALLSRWDRALTTTYRAVQQESSANHMQVVDEPALVAGPSPSEPMIDLGGAVLGAAIGLLIASGLVVLDRRRQAHASPAG